MAKIIGIEDISAEMLNYERQQGGKFVTFEYCIFVITFKRPSDIYFIKEGESTAGKSVIYTLISLLLGWWGIPWGPIYTIGSLITNLGGGKDVTSTVVASLNEA